MKRRTMTEMESQYQIIPCYSSRGQYRYKIRDTTTRKDVGETEWFDHLHEAEAMARWMLMESFWTENEEPGVETDDDDDSVLSHLRHTPRREEADSTVMYRSGQITGIFLS